MKVRDIMTKKVTSVQGKDNVMKAATIMRDCDIGAVLVCEGNREIGIVTDRDIVVRIAAFGINSAQAIVASIMSKNIQSCFEDDSLTTAAQIMESHKIRRLVVRDAGGQITGILSLGDLAVRGDRHLSEEILEQVSEPAHHSR